MDNSFNKIRTLMQGIVLLAVSAIGVLGLIAFISEGDVWMSVMFGTVTPLAIALGSWLIVKSRRM